MSAEEEGLPECRATGAWIQIWPSGIAELTKETLNRCMLECRAAGAWLQI